jgi:hypothetical protein
MNLLFLILFVGFIAIMVLFGILRLISNRTYRPSQEDVATVIKATINGTVSFDDFDKFSSVRIAYDKQLESIRKKFNDITEDPTCLDLGPGKEVIMPLNDKGRRLLNNLLRELDSINMG